MKIEITRQRVPDVIKTGDGVQIEGYGECMVIEITSEAEGTFNAMAPNGDVLPLRLHFLDALDAPTTLQ
jgi:hypothetical protein